MSFRQEYTVETSILVAQIPYKEIKSSIQLRKKFDIKWHQIEPINTFFDEYGIEDTREDTRMQAFSRRSSVEYMPLNSHSSEALYMQVL